MTPDEKRAAFVQEAEEYAARHENWCAPCVWYVTELSDEKSRHILALWDALKTERERSKRIEAMALKLDCDCAGEYDREALPPTCYRCQILKALRSGVREGA